MEADKESWEGKSSNKKNKIHPFKIGDEEVIITAQNKNSDEEERDSWTGTLDFFFSALSYSVGLGAIWRFPYLCYSNGGGAFLIPFVICGVLFGLPLMYLEMAVGQFSSRGPVLSWVMVPLFKGLGVSMNIMNNFVNWYYIMIVAYSLYFLVLTMYHGIFSSELPWKTCGEFASDYCVDDFNKTVLTKCSNKTVEIACKEKCFGLRSDLPGSTLNCSFQDSMEFLGITNQRFPSEDYWFNSVLQRNESINELGHLVWQLVLVLAASWIICFLFLFRGVKMSGKIVYVVSLLPYCVLLVLGIASFTYDGAIKGVAFLFQADTDKLWLGQTWSNAAVQVFFTLSLAQGGNITLASYNKFKKNILKDTIVLAVANLLTCILAAFVVFAYIGILSVETRLDMEDVAAEGPSLIYIVYPYAVTKLPAPAFWAFLFFIMMLCLGLGTMMASVETLSTSLEDVFPILKARQRNKSLTLAAICLGFFLLGLLFCFQSGSWWISVFSAYAADWALSIVGILECVSVAWFYGLANIERDLAAMYESKKDWRLFANTFIIWKATWAVVTPAFLLFIILYPLLEGEDNITIVENGVAFPAWTASLWYVFGIVAMSGSFIWTFYEAYRVYREGKSWGTLLKRDEAWKPLKQDNQREVLATYETYRPVSFRKLIGIK